MVRQLHAPLKILAKLNFLTLKACRIQVCDVSCDRIDVLTQGHKARKPDNHFIAHDASFCEVSALDQKPLVGGPIKDCTQLSLRRATPRGLKPQNPCNLERACAPQIPVVIKGIAMFTADYFPRAKRPLRKRISQMQIRGSGNLKMRREQEWME
jgi:hypothetical protein